jgi:hypothetical protein
MQEPHVTKEYILWTFCLPSFCLGYRFWPE